MVLQKDLHNQFNLCHIIDLQSSCRSLILYILLPFVAHNSNFKATENKDNSVVV